MWKEWVPEVLCGFRMVAAQSYGYRPFFVAYKHFRLLLGWPMLVGPRMPLSWDLICADKQDYTTELCSLYASIRASLQNRLVETGEAEKRAYDKRTDLLNCDLELDMLVMRQQWRTAQA